MKPVKTTISCLLLGATVVSRAIAQQPLDSVRAFVQSFYDWYVPIARTDNPWPSDYAVLTQRPWVLSTELLGALRADSAAQARVQGVTVGLDWDPFLKSQDPCERYEVGSATVRGRRYLVEIYAVCSGKKDDAPHLVAELVRRRTSWVFSNFRDPKDNTDLLTGLRLLRRARERNRR